LIIPKANKKYPKTFITKSEGKKLCVLQVENDYRIWKPDDYFIFDDTCIHNAWNYTRENRIVLIVDLKK
jgi:aspartyl/asparaginyl beta-hydroxylase (cupin superfamily)